MRRSPDQTRPSHRRLRIFAIDPMVSRSGDHQATVQVKFEELVREAPTPPSSEGSAEPAKALQAVSFKGRRIEVVDVDASGASPIWLRPVDLDDAHVAMQHGLEPSESDPQFHQQMAYAVATRTLEQFDRALGRVVYFRERRRLRLVPHAFRGSNAFYHPDLRAVLFGYFPASESSPGENLPGQTIFTCLSHDIIAHEVTHAVVDLLRPYFGVATNPQVRAFHEAIADVVAVFQRLTVHEIVQRALQDSGGSLRKSSQLVEIAAQFGQGLGGGQALRTALEDKKRIQDVHEEHDLGAILLAAIFEAFQKTHERRSADLIRIATGGSGILPGGALHPDLVARLTTECVRTANAVLNMCIRAIDYLPPADVDFGAFLRALVTADWELNPLDEGGLRAAVVEACRRRGIFAAEAGSLEVGALLLDGPPPADWSGHQAEFSKWVDLAVRVSAEEQREQAPEDEALDLAMKALFALPFHYVVQSEAFERASDAEKAMAGMAMAELSPSLELRRRIGAWFKKLADGERHRLGMTAAELKSCAFHPGHRVAADGTLRFGLVVQLVEQRWVELDTMARLVPTGATLVIDVTGQVRYLVRPPPPKQRRADLEATVRASRTNALGWTLQDPFRDPFAVDFRGLHAGRRT